APSAFPGSGAAPVFERSATLVPETVRYGGFLLRVGARLIDGVILAIAGQLVGALVMGAVMPEEAAAIAQMQAQGRQPTEEDIMMALKVFTVISLVSTSIAVLYETLFLVKFGAT